jgi:SPP1 gp7 family putative phage head morphogenesis protein
MDFDLAQVAKEAGVKRPVVELRPIEPRIGTEDDYFRILRAMLAETATFVRNGIIPAADNERQFMVIRDAAGDRLGQMFAALRRLLERLYGVSVMMVREILDLAAEHHTADWKQRARSPTGIDVGAVISRNDLTDLMSLAAQRNASLIKSLSEDVVKRVEQTTLENLTQGGTAKDLRKRLTKEFGVLDSRAKTIARDQTAKLTSDLTRFRQEQAGIDRYKWSSSRDERVVSRRSKPPAVTGHPGTTSTAGVLRLR